MRKMAWVLDLAMVLAHKVAWAGQVPEALFRQMVQDDKNLR